MISIVRSREEDSEQILRLFHACRHDMNAQGIKQWDEVYPNHEVVEEDIANQSLFLAKDNEEIVGVITLDSQASEEYESVDWRYLDGRMLVIHRLAVKPSCQGQGIASMLMNFAHDEGRRQQYRSVRLDVYSGNARAVRFYEKLGYETRGEVTFPRRTLPFYCMERSLS